MPAVSGSGVSRAVPAGWAPERVAGVCAAKAARARGRIQVQLQARPAVFGRLPPAHKLLHHALAWRAPSPAARTGGLALLVTLNSLAGHRTRRSHVPLGLLGRRALMHAGMEEDDSRRYQLPQVPGPGDARPLPAPVRRPGPPRGPGWRAACKGGASSARASPAPARRSHEVSAVTTPLFVAVPMVQVVLGYFPLAPNRWFGIGFFAYYLLATPLLYKARPWRAVQQTYCRVRATLTAR